MNMGNKQKNRKDRIPSKYPGLVSPFVRTVRYKPLYSDISVFLRFSTPIVLYLTRHFTPGRFYCAKRERFSTDFSRHNSFIGLFCFVLMAVTVWDLAFTMKPNTSQKVMELTVVLEQTIQALRVYDEF